MEMAAPIPREWVGLQQFAAATQTKLHELLGKLKEKLTVAYLKEKTAGQGSTPSTPSSSSGMRSAAARLLGTGNGSRALSFVGGNGASRAVAGSSRMAGGLGTSTSLGGSQAVANYDGKGAYIIFNAADTLFISDLNSQDKDPIKSIHFSNSNPLCHAFDPEAKEGHDLIIGMGSGDVYSMSLRQQLQDPGRKPVAAQHYNKGDKDGTNSGSRCTSVAWVPERESIFVVSHSDGNLFVYDKCKDGNTECTFPAIKDPAQLMVSHAKSSKSNPIARWHICQGSINTISFSPDGAYLATVGRDGYLRVFDFSKEQLIFGGKSYYGALLCCTWSSDGKYLLTGGEDDLVQVWSMDDRKIVAWGEGHNSWVSGVAFDSYWSPPNSDGTGENVVYRFGSVGQVPGDQDPSARSKTSKYFASKTEKDPNVKEEDASVGKSTDKSLSKRKFQKSRDELEDDIKTLPTKKVHKDEDGDNDFVAPSRKSLLLRLWLTIQ